jgi:hypothetical protein
MICLLGEGSGLVSPVASAYKNGCYHNTDKQKAKINAFTLP